MKNQSSKYEQLVEAQSPEPQAREAAQPREENLEEPPPGGGEESSCSGVVAKDSLEIEDEPEAEESTNINTVYYSASNINKIDEVDERDNTLQGYASAGSKGSRHESIVSLEKSAVLHQLAPARLGSRCREDSYQTCDSLASSLVSTQSTATCSHQTTINNNMNYSSIQLGDQLELNQLKSGSQLEKQSFEIVWRNLSFSYKSKTGILAKCLAAKTSHVLKDISGRFGSNQLVAVIGPSGCGKTTLLQFLAGNNGSSRGNLRILGLEEPKVAFIGQDDGLLPGLTARETLIYASRLQNTKENFDHEEHIRPILNALGLSECADRSITKLSGGQAKRVTIAQELLYPTNLLILDEVTSGLDASTSYSIVKLLKELVANRSYPMTIVISIHQPSARLFAVFDQVYVMGDGHCLYEGSCQVQIINNYLRQFGLECPTYHNIADYLIEIASESANSSADDCKLSENILTIKEQMIQHQRKRFAASNFQDEESPTGTMIAKYRKNVSATGRSESPDRKEVSMLLDKSSSSVPLFDAIERARDKRQRPVIVQFVIHLKRSMLRISRSKILTYLQLFTYILLGLQLATFYGADIGLLSGCPHLPMSLLPMVLAEDKSADNLNLEMRRMQENMNFLLVAIMTATFAALEITVITFPLEAKTVKREWRNGWYRVSSYFLGRTLADLPFQLTFVIVFCTIIYTLTGQLGLTSWRFGSFVLVIIMSALVAQTVGFIFGAIFMDNLPAAVFTAPLVIFPALLFSGFFSRVSQIPTFYKPMTYISHFRYAFDALIVTLYGYNRCQCDQEVLTSYHASFKNQSNSIRDLFQALFMNPECSMSAMNSNNGNEQENSIEDSPPSTPPEVVMLVNNATTISPSPINHSSSLGSLTKSVEDSLVDTIFEQMFAANSTSTPETFTTARNGTSLEETSNLGNKFAIKITKMLNSQANYGHQVPTECHNFNPYLMTEFDMHDDDLIFGLMMLFIYVLVSRLICNAILSFTIASRIH